MTTKELPDELISLCRQAKFEKATKELYGNDIVSIEPEGAPDRETRGLEAIIAKGEKFNEMIEEFHSFEMSDPLVADKFFSCSMKIDATFKGGFRNTLNEICLYTVEDGKIVREEFFYNPSPS